ncbi:hypothetical protein [Colwellia sp. UCD-KL20]|uniref:hypothetical protein n=1 Tax=Colwellia sp. UCD-KL20 TaxID=1917165 RepID=UPI000970C6EE|nr:hypothetical protein [Colwellia sp. UCD-KL20]
MRLILILFISISFNSSANQKFSGQWEGFDPYAGSYNSHILEIDDNGSGFYALSLGGSLSEEFFFPIHMDDLQYSDGYYKLVVTKPNNDVTITVLFAEYSISHINVMTIVRTTKDVMVMSLSWELFKARSHTQNERLYDFAKKLYNKSLKQDK